MSIPKVGTIIQVVEYNGPFYDIVRGARAVVTKIFSEDDSFVAETADGSRFLMVEGDDKWIECVVGNHRD